MGVMLWSDAELKHTDKGQYLKSNIFQNLTGMRCTTSYHLETNGVVKRISFTIKNILSKVLNENQGDWNLWLPQEHIRWLCIHPQMSHRITCFLGEKLISLSWPNSERQTRNKTPSKCPKVCARHENKLLTSTRSCKGDCVTQIRGLLWCKSCGKSEPSWWQSVETSFSHHKEDLLLKLVCLW